MVTWKRPRGTPGPRATLKKTVATLRYSELELYLRQGSRARLGADIAALVHRLLTLRAGCWALPFLLSGPLEDIATERAYRAFPSDFPNCWAVLCTFELLAVLLCKPKPSCL